MAEEKQSKSHEYGTSETTEVEIKDRGVFDFLGKKKEEEKPQKEAIAHEFEKVKVSEPETYKVEKKKEEEADKKHSLLEKLHRSDSSSSSSSEEEEEGEGGEKKKKKKEKKGLKEKIQEKIGGEHKEEQKYEDTAVPVEKVEVDPAHPEEKKGFLDKIKEKLPGQQKKTEEVPPPPPLATSEYSYGASETGATVAHEGEAKEKKGILEKIKEKLPGYHAKTDEEKEKEKEKESGAY